jgi:putative SOS response-associated peptidase YedK
MCNRYRPARAEQLELFERLDLWEEPKQFIGEPPGLRFFAKDIGPWQQGVFVRRNPRTGKLEEVAGQWGLIGDNWPAPRPPKDKGKKPIMTNNARFETIATRPTFKGPWLRGQRCIIPAGWHIEPCWETGKNEWWQFRLKSGRYAYALAGIWNAWTDKATGEVVESYSMITLNADQHSLFKRMHRPDMSRPETLQDKRAVVALLPSTFDVWLAGTVEEATRVLVLQPEEAFDAAPERLAGLGSKPHQQHMGDVLF